MTSDRSRPALAVGLVAVIAFSFGVSVVINSTVTAEPGSMDRGFGQLYGSAFVLGSAAGLWWALRRISGFDARLRRRVGAVMATTAVVSVLVFGSVTVSSVFDHRRQERALEAMTSWRFAFEDDLADAYWAWYQDHGGTDEIYTGDYQEWWSLDPDRDGIRDLDAPIMRVLRDDGWSDHGLAIFESVDDQIVDQIEWAEASAPGETHAWCIPVSDQRSIIIVEWWNAEPRRCEGPQISTSG